MNSRVSIYRTALFALILLALPGPAWAQVLVKGQVRFSDGSPVVGATVTAQEDPNAVPIAFSTTDAAGMYQLRLSWGRAYDLRAELKWPGFTASQRIASSLTVYSDTVRDLTLSDILLQGRVIDRRGLPLAGVKLHGVQYGADSKSLSPVSGSDGRFQVRMLKGSYSYLRLEPPAGSGYPVTPLENQYFVSSGSRDFVVIDPVYLSGQLRFSDGSAAAGATVYAHANVGNYFVEATADATGMYRLPLAPGAYDVGGDFSGPGFSGNQKLLTALTVNSNKVQPLTFGDVWLNLQVMTRNYEPAPGVKLSGWSPAGRPASFNTLSAVTGADGCIRVRVLPGYYPSMVLIPEPGSPYLYTDLYGMNITNSEFKTYMVLTPVKLSGQVRFADWMGVARAVVLASGPNTGDAVADEGGMYQLSLAPGTYSVKVFFSVPGFYGYQRVASNLDVTSDRVSDLTLGDIWLQGRVLNSSGQPMAGVKLSGRAYVGVDDNTLEPVSGPDGRFQVRMLPGTYTSMSLTPATASGYAVTPLPDETFTASVTRDYVVNDINECVQNNGGCSVNATCTNLPGSYACTCNSGYSGDGVTCTQTPKVVTLTAPNGGEQWTSGTVRNITWTSSAVNSVHLHYSLDNGSSWVLIATNVPAAPGTHAWTLPSGVTSTSATVRIADAQTGLPVDLSDAAFSVTSPGRVIINEVLANEAGSATSGEFIELVNVGGSSIEIGGWTLWDATSARHIFAPGTVLAPGKALVVFGAASGIPAGVVNAVGSSSGALSLNNTGDTVTLKDPEDTSIDSLTYSSALAAADGVSMTLGQEATPGTGFVPHNTLSPLLSSAGSRVDGTAF
jgi:hypothetical protein